ncbi:uncharacterized protein [Eurosta solidaginis]|uniref:uncharacterized protein isoform X2 n=1 Tax=Eurosta solidaginis TaxID=178769 RepID=UPI003531431A
MQTAVDCNSSNSSGNNSTTTTTTTTVTESNNIKLAHACSELLSHANITSCATIASGGKSQSTPAIMLTPVAMLEQRNVLRHRLQIGAGEEIDVGVGHIIGGTPGINHAGSSNAAYTTHKIIEAPVIDLAEHLGSNVEYMSVTPSPSPQASPSKKAQQQKTCISLPIALLSAATSTSSSTSSSSSSSSNSSTSSVIASPVNVDRRRRLLEAKPNDNVSNDDALSSIGNNSHISDKDERAVRRAALTAKGLPLHNVYEEHLTFITPTSPLTPAFPLVSPSTSSSSSSLSACTNSTSTSASADSISLDSTTTNSSKSSLVTIKSPAFDPTVQLQQWQDMPKYLQFNPYVLKGYRPLTTFKGCLLSLFQWHNETINILTHDSYSN